MQYLTLVFLIFGVMAPFQSQEDIESKIRSFNQRNERDSSIITVTQYYDLLKLQIEDEGVFDLLKAHSVNLIYQKQFDDAILFLNDLISQVEINENYKQVNSLKSILVGVYGRRGEINKALELLEELKIYYSNISDLSNLGTTFNNFGNCYNITNKSEEAIRYYIKADSVFTIVGDISKALGVRNGIATLYYNISQYDKAKKYLDNVIDIASVNKDTITLALAKTNYANVLNSIQPIDHDSIIILRQQVLQHYSDINNIYRIFLATMDLGASYSKMGETTKALTYQTNCLKQLRLFDPGIRTKSKLYLGLAKTYQRLERYKQSLKYFDLFEENYPEVEFPETRTDFLESKSKSLFGIREYKKAYEELSLAMIAKDSTFKHNLNAKIDDIETKYTVEKTNLENKILLTENTATKAIINNQRYFLALAGLGVITFGLLAYFYRDRKKHAEELKILKEKEAQLLKEENDRLEEANQGLSLNLSKLKNNPAAILNEIWVINPKGKKPIQVKLGDILAISTSTDKANVLEYIIANSDFRPPERRSMKNLEADPNFPKEVFQRVHQSHFINIHKIISIEPIARKVFIQGIQDPVNISTDKYLEELQKAYDSLNKTVTPSP